MLTCSVIAGILSCTPALPADFDLADYPGSYNSVTTETVRQAQPDKHGPAMEPTVRQSPYFRYAVLYDFDFDPAPVVFSDISVPAEWRNESRIELGNGFYLMPTQFGIKSWFDQPPIEMMWI